METVKRREIEHELHGHPLVLVEGDEQMPLSEKAAAAAAPKYCHGCGDLILKAPFFTCSHSDCTLHFHLHQKCAEAPYYIPPNSNLPLHRTHSPFAFFLRGRPPSYPKSSQNLKLGENYFNDDDSIQHQFILLENHKDEVKKVNCFKCSESLINHSFYISFECKFYFHKKCFDELPLIEIDHHCHPVHTLLLQFSEQDCLCKICRNRVFGKFFYHCSVCKFDFHFECVWQNPIIEDKRYHEHPFTLFWKQDPFICNACGTVGNTLSYTCWKCHLQLHKHCTSLPRVIKASPHKHFLYLKYSLKKKELEEHECQFCLGEVKAEYGSYQCLKKDCNYIAHVNCATENDDVFEEVDPQKDVEEEDEASFDVVDEEDGKATIIKHFCHEHNLVLLEDKLKFNGRNICEGCMLSISDLPFYNCSQCIFSLHKTCAELPKTMHHWFHRYKAQLEAIDFMKCDLCYRYCSGFFYKSRGYFIYFCLRCAIIPNVVKWEGHEHILFFDRKCKRKCNGCGVGSQRGAFRCRKCSSFALDFACMTLPREIEHKCDEHLLQLTYGDKEEEYEEQNYCYICEEKREAISHWYYRCPTSTCNTCAHTKCVLGKFPFVKDGITWWRYHHPHKEHHRVTFVQKINEGFPKCNGCNQLCQDQTLKCVDCNYFLHAKCVPGRLFWFFDED